MCGLCGIFGESAHWANQLQTNGQSSDPVRRRHIRRERIAILNRMLATWHIRISDWQGTQFQVTSATGKSELADNLSHIWLAVENIRGQAFDPLQLPENA